MKNLKVHVRAVQNLINRGPSSQSKDYTDSFIAHVIKQARATLFKRKMDKHQNLSEFNYQTLCISLEVSTYHNCDALPSGVGCTVKKSKCKLPTDIGNKWRSSLQVKTINNKNIPNIPPIINQYRKYSINSNDRYGWFIEDGYLIIVGNLDIDLVVVKGLWEDPDEIDETLCPEDGNNTSDICKSFYTADFPIDPDLVIPMYQIAMELIGVSYRYPQDNVANARSPEQPNHPDPNEREAAN